MGTLADQVKWVKEESPFFRENKRDVCAGPYQSPWFMCLSRPFLIQSPHCGVISSDFYLTCLSHCYVVQQRKKIPCSKSLPSNKSSTFLKFLDPKLLRNIWVCQKSFQRGDVTKKFISQESRDEHLERAKPFCMLDRKSRTL